jgi:uncharacterized membrane protein
MATRKEYRIVGNPGLLRDGHSKGLITTDIVALRQDKARQASKASKQQTEERLNTLEEKLSRIETLLIEIANK